VIAIIIAVLAAPSVIALPIVSIWSAAGKSCLRFLRFRSRPNSEAIFYNVVGAVTPII